MDGYGGSNMFFPPGETGFGRGVGEDLHPHTRGRPERSLLLRGKIIILDNPSPEV